MRADDIGSIIDLVIVDHNRLGLWELFDAAIRIFHRLALQILIARMSDWALTLGYPHEFRRSGQSAKVAAWSFATH
jgi:hypothetical protein